MSVFTPVAPALRCPITQAVSDGRRMGLSAAHVEGVSQAFRQAGAAWFAPRRAWVFRQPARVGQLADELRAALAPIELIDLDACAHDIVRAAENPCPAYFAEMLDVQIMPLTGGGYAVSSAFDPFMVDAMHALNGRFHRHAAAWAVTCPVKQILEALSQIAGVDETSVFVHEMHMQLEELAAKPKSSIPISVPGAAPPDAAAIPGGDDEPPEGKGFLSAMCGKLERIPVDEAMLARAVHHCGLYDYQGDGVHHLLARSSCLLGDDMGLGKSRMAVVAARIAAQRGRILIVCPASLRINWEREIHAVFPQDTVGMVGEDRMATLKACRWVISNYERLGGLVRETALCFEVMTIDEAHYLKEHSAGRTRNAFILADRIPRRFLLTGTPILSREIEVHTLLRLSGHPIGHLELAEFRKQFAGGTEQRAALAEALSDWMLRRSKSVLKTLGAKTRQVRYVTPAEGLATYQAVMNDDSLGVMPKIVKLRQSLEAMKLDFLIDTAGSMRPEDKLIVFVEYIDTVEALKQALTQAGIGCTSLVGSDAMKKRQKAVDAFQNEADCRVFIGTTSAAGVGITLTAANYVTFASLPWTPALMRQAEDRAYRNGQTRDVIVLLPIVPNTIDEQIVALLESKTELEKDVVEQAVKERLTKHPDRMAAAC